MSIRFNADEIFEIAEKMEQNAAVFYRTAAAKVASPSASRMLRELASWETQHERIFAAMRTELSAEARELLEFDPDNEDALYLEALADHTVYTLTADPLELFGEAPSLERILRIAIEREKEAVLFYSGIKPLVPPKLGQTRVEQIIKEEMKHVTILGEQLRQAGS